MTENERVREVRKSENLTLEEFGKRLGVTRGAMSAIENAARGLTEQMCRSICREFNIREAWLRDGEEPMRAEQSREQQIDGFIQQALSEEPEGIRRRLVSALAKLDESDWIALDKAWGVWMKLTGESSK